MMSFAFVGHGSLAFVLPHALCPRRKEALVAPETTENSRAPNGVPLHHVSTADIADHPVSQSAREPI